jgi:hypothetical protein
MPIFPSGIKPMAQIQNQNSSLAYKESKPDPASVHILYAGNLADDDFMWIVECTIEEFQKMLNSPTAWVQQLSTLPDWHLAGSNTPAPPPVLLKNFTMRIQQREKDSPSDLITIQGISNTGIVSVRASHASAVLGVENLKSFRERDTYASVEDDRPASEATAFSTYWDDLAYDASTASHKKLYAVNVDTTDLRYYGHFEITLPGQGTTASRLAAASAFILAFGSDPQGFTNMLNTLEQTTTYITSYGVRAGVPIRMVASSGYTPQILYTSLDDTTYATCMMLDGTYNPVSGICTVDNPIVKKYGNDDAPAPTGGTSTPTTP